MYQRRGADEPSALQDGWSADALSGKKDSGHVGILAIYLIKRSILDYLLKVFLEQHAFQSEAKAKVKEIFPATRPFASISGRMTARQCQT